MHFEAHTATQALKASFGEDGHNAIQAAHDPPGHPLGGGGGVGLTFGALHLSEAEDGQDPPLSFQHGGVDLSSSGQSLNSSY